MSAYIVDDAHIDVLIDIAYQFDRKGRAIHMSRFSWKRGDDRAILDEVDATELGRVLLVENARSVSDRYSEVQTPAALTYTYRPTGRQFSAAEALNTIAVYAYQACEHDAWEQSEAHAFCVSLRLRVGEVAIGHDGPFGWTDEALGRVSAAAH